MSSQELDRIQRKLLGCSEDEVAVLYKESNLSNKDIENILRIIKDWYNQQEHLPKDALDDQTFIRMYFICKCSIERTKTKIDNYITVRSAVPEFYKNRDPFSPDLLKAIENGPFLFMPERTDEHYRVMCIGAAPDTSSYDPVNVMRGLLMLCDIRMRCDVVVGDLCVLDCSNIKIGHLTNLTPALLKKSIHIIQECYGARIIGMYFLNLPSFAYNIMLLAKSLLKKKVAERFHVCSSLKELHEKIDPKYLPVELGGPKHTFKSLRESTIEAMQSDYWVNWYRQSEIKIADESKRRNKASNKFNEMTGMMGSFRKLDID